MGSQLLISYLLSPDTACQRVGALGIGNLATNPDLRIDGIGAMEPPAARPFGDIEIEIQRFAVLAMANLVSTVENHQAVVEEAHCPFSSLCQMPQTKRCGNMQPMHW